MCVKYAVNGEFSNYQTTKETAQALMQTALKSELGQNIVESLTTEIGPRLAGSEVEERAREWGFN